MKKVLSILALLSAISIVSNVSAKVSNACKKAKNNLKTAKKAFNRSYYTDPKWASLFSNKVAAQNVVNKEC